MLRGDLRSAGPDLVDELEDEDHVVRIREKTTKSKVVSADSTG
jgi:hypothetical protein